MKKSYIAPTVEIVELKVEGVIALSVPVGDGEIGAGDSYSQKGGWSSEDWSAPVDEDFE